jgi:undecaprenyl-diphosphatase
VEHRAILTVLRGVSRIGDGWLTAIKAAVVVVGRGEGLAGRFLLASLVGLVAQKALKLALGRPRPCLTDGGPLQRVAIPDTGSFPSGHTLHATLAAAAVAGWLPTPAPAYLVFVLLTAISRVALGVHYPSDVAAGAALGAALATLVYLA